MVFGCESGPQERKKVSYRTSAKENFIKGKKAFDDEDYLVIESADLLRHVADRLVPLADCILPNRFELEWLSGISVQDPRTADEAAQRESAS